MDNKTAPARISTAFLAPAGVAIVVSAIVWAFAPPAALAQGSVSTSAAHDISGIWWTTSYSPKLQVSGGALPYNEKGAALYAKNVAGLKDGSIPDEARRICVPDGIPRILGNPYPFQIIEAPTQTVIAYELNHVIRTITMDKPQLSQHELEIAPAYSGHSVGHWEGDTLVVETAGFNEETFLDATGAPHSDQATTVERIRKINGGKQLEDVVTVTDHVYLTQPVTARFVYDAHPDERLREYVCGEQHRDVSHFPGIAEARRAKGL